MSGINRVIIMGNLGQNPELSSTASGVSKCVLAIATSYKKQDGTEISEWHKVTAWGKQAEIIAQYCQKGSQIYIEGKLRYGQYEKDGQKHYATDIDVREFQFCGSQNTKNEPQNQQRGGGAGYSGRNGQQQQSYDGYNGRPTNQQQQDDDIPF